MPWTGEWIGDWPGEWLAGTGEAEPAPPIIVAPATLSSRRLRLPTSRRPAVPQHSRSNSQD